MWGDLMSLDYVKGSFRRVSENVLAFKLVNRIDSGSANINLKVLLDGEDVTGKSTMKIGGQETRRVKPSMHVTSYYNDLVLVTIELDGPVKRDLHKAKVTCSVEMLGSYSAEFEETI
jgi:hypothetical protein